MPYVDAAAQALMTQREVDPETPGELTFFLYWAACQYLADKDEIRYADLNEVRGALVGAWQEFEQQIVRPYEDQKQSTNPVPVADELRRRICKS